MIETNNPQKTRDRETNCRLTLQQKARLDRCKTRDELGAHRPL